MPRLRAAHAHCRKDSRTSAEDRGQQQCRLLRPAEACARGSSLLSEGLRSTWARLSKLATLASVSVSK